MPLSILNPNHDYSDEEINVLINANITLTSNLIVIPSVLNQSEMSEELTRLRAEHHQIVLLFQAQPSMVSSHLIEDYKDDTPEQPQWYLACKYYQNAQPRLIATEKSAEDKQLIEALTHYCQRQPDSSTDVETVLSKKVLLLRLAYRLLGLKNPFSPLTDYHLSAIRMTENYFSNTQKIFKSFSKHQLVLSATMLGIDGDDLLSSSFLPPIEGEYLPIRLVGKFPDKQEMQDATIYLKCNPKINETTGQIHYQFLNQTQDVISGSFCINLLTTKKLRQALQIRKDSILFSFFSFLFKTQPKKEYCCDEFEIQEIVKLTRYKAYRYPKIYQYILPDLIKKFASGMRDWIDQVTKYNVSSLPALQILWPVYVPSPSMDGSTTLLGDEKVEFTTASGTWYLIEWHIVLPFRDCQVFLQSAYLPEGIPSSLQIIIEGLHDAFQPKLNTLDQHEDNAYFYERLRDIHNERRKNDKPSDQVFDFANQPQTTSPFSDKIFHHTGHRALLRQVDIYSSGAAITSLALLRLNGYWANKYEQPLLRGAQPLRQIHQSIWQTIMTWSSLTTAMTSTPHEQALAFRTTALQQQTQPDLPATVINDKATWETLFPANPSAAPRSEQAQKLLKQSHGFFVLVSDAKPIYLFAHAKDFDFRKLAFAAAILDDIEMLKSIINWSNMLVPCYQRLIKITDPLHVIDIQLDNLQILQFGIIVLNGTAGSTHLIEKGIISPTIINWLTHALKMASKLRSDASTDWQALMAFAKDGGDLQLLITALQDNDASSTHRHLTKVIAQSKQHIKFLNRQLNARPSASGFVPDLEPLEASWLGYLLQSLKAMDAALQALHNSMNNGDTVSILQDAPYHNYHDATAAIELLRGLHKVIHSDYPNEQQVNYLFVEVDTSCSLPQLTEALTERISNWQQSLRTQRAELLKNAMAFLTPNESKIEEIPYYYEIIAKQFGTIKTWVETTRQEMLKQHSSRLKIYNPCTVSLFATKPTNFPQPNLSVFIYPLPDSKENYEASICHNSGKNLTKVLLNTSSTSFLETIASEFPWRELDEPWRDENFCWSNRSWNVRMDVRHQCINVFIHWLTTHYLHQQIDGVDTIINFAQAERKKYWLDRGYQLCHSDSKIDSDAFGNTLLHTACAHGSWRTAAYLIQTPCNTFPFSTLENLDILPSIHCHRLLTRAMNDYLRTYDRNHTGQLPHMIGFLPEEKSETTSSSQWLMDGIAIHKDFALKETSWLQWLINRLIIHEDVLEVTSSPQWLIDGLIVNGNFATAIMWLIQATDVAFLTGGLSIQREAGLMNYLANEMVRVCTEQDHDHYMQIMNLFHRLLSEQSQRRSDWGNSLRHAAAWKVALNAATELRLLESPARATESIEFTTSTDLLLFKSPVELFPFAGDKKGAIRAWHQEVAQHLIQMQTSTALSTMMLQQEQLRPHHRPGDRFFIQQIENPLWYSNPFLSFDPVFKLLTRWVIQLMPPAHVTDAFLSGVKQAEVPRISQLLRRLEHCIQQYTAYQHQVIANLDTKQEHDINQIIDLQTSWRNCRDEFNELREALQSSDANHAKINAALNQWQTYLLWQYHYKRNVLAGVLETVLHTYSSRLYTASNYVQYVRKVLRNYLENWQQQQRHSHHDISVALLTEIDTEVETWSVAQLCEGLMATSESHNDAPLTLRIQMVVNRLEQMFTENQPPSFTRVKRWFFVSNPHEAVLKKLLTDLKYYLKQQAQAQDKAIQAWCYDIDTQAFFATLRREIKPSDDTLDADSSTQQQPIRLIKNAGSIN